MTALALAGTFAAGAFCRWALTPVWLAFEFGRRAERIAQRKRAAS